MFEKLEIFRMAHAMATHAGTRQAVIAQNMANADTPGFKARDTAPFAETYDAQQGGFAPRATRAGHLHGTTTGPAIPVSETRDAPSDPNGNSVSLETEMLKAAEVKRQHDRAISIYKSSLTILRAATSSR